MLCYVQLEVSCWCSGLLMSVLKSKVLRTESPYVCPRVSADTAHPRIPELLKSSESPVQEPHLVFSHPFIVVSSCQDIDTSVTRRSVGGTVRGTGTTLYLEPALWTMDLACELSTKISVSPGGARQARIQPACPDPDPDTLPKLPWQNPGSTVCRPGGRGQEGTAVKGKRRAIWLKWACFVMLITASFPRRICVLKKESWLLKWISNC